jgi:hypothetical protein
LLEAILTSNHIVSGIPDSRYSLTRVADESYEVPLQRILAPHLNIDASKVLLFYFWLSHNHVHLTFSVLIAAR